MPRMRKLVQSSNLETHEESLFDSLVDINFELK
jgi:hypothetical protein